MRQESFADDVKRAVFGAAGLLQAMIAAAPLDEAGGADRWTVRESDLQIALATCLQARVGARVRREVSAAGQIQMLTKGRYGPIDVGVLRENSPGIQVYVENKWCAEDKLFEVLWDAIKLAQFVSMPDTGACYLVYGAPADMWEAHEGWPLELFEMSEHDTGRLLQKYSEGWDACLKGGGARPARLPEVFSTYPGPQVPIHTSDGLEWQLRGVQIAVPSEEQWIEMSESGWPV